MRLSFKALIWLAASAAGVAAFAAVVGSQVLPPGTDSDCSGQVPIVVATDEAAQSDLYSAATLAGVIETECIVLAGPRDGEFPADQLARLDAASPGGWVMGGEAAVPEEKVAGRNLKRLNGVDRWHTARLAGAIAADPDGDIAALTEATAPPEGELGGGSVIVDDVEVRLPPGLDASCEGQVPIVVAVDAAAQSDLYSAATLAGVLDTTCYVLAGARGEPMSDEQRARLEAAESEGWIVGGPAAVPDEKVSGFTLERQGGEDRWETARLIGATAVEQAAAATSTTTTTERVVRRTSGGGGSSRAPSRTPTRTPPPVVPTVPPTTPTTQPAATTPFTPSVSVEVPQLEGTAGANIWASEEFEVALARATGAHADCSLGTSVMVTFTVQADGSVTADDSEMPDELIGTLGDDTTCDYTVTFPAAPSDNDDDFDWTMTAPTDTEVALNATSSSVTGTYTVGDVTFDPNADITVPAGNAGAAFNAEVSSSTAGCSGNPTAVTLTYTVQSDETVAAEAANEPLIAYPASAAPNSDACSYDVAFGANENGGTTLELQANSSTSVTGTSQGITATYAPPVPAGSFRPAITVSVPQLDGTMSANIWAGETFDVTLARATSADTGCTPVDETLTFTVQDNGSTTSGLIPPLVGTVSGTTTTCDYTVTFPAALTDDDDEFDWTMTAPATTEVTVSEASQDAIGAYTVGEVTFDADATITVPAGHAAKRFEVDFTSAQQGCTDRDDLLYTVQSDDTVAAEDTNAQLVAYPAGATMTTDECTYTVAFPTNEADGATLTLVTANPAPDATASATDQDISATYIVTPRVASTFMPTVTVEVPQLVGTTANTNIWHTTQFEVTLARASGVTHPDCSLASEQTVTFVVQADGSADGNVPTSLVHTTADDVPCSYTVTFESAPVDTPGGDFDWTLTDPATTEVTLSQTSQSATGAYTVGTVTFVPDTTITVPTGGAHATAEFEVDFASTQTDCADNTLTYIVQADDSVTGAQVNTPLVAYPAGATSTTPVCSYAATFPPTEKDGTTLELQTGADTTATGTDQAVSATYELAPTASTFMPTITVTVPGLDGTTSGQNLWNGVEFDVMIAQVGGSHADCSLSAAATVTYTVQADGTVTTTDEDLPETLIGTLADQTTKCSYTVTFPAAPTDASDSDFGWTMTAPATTEVTLSDTDMDSMSASADYTVDVITFQPDATVTVPSGTAMDTSFTAVFSSADADCVGQTHTYTVAAATDTTAAAAGTNTALVAYPADATSTDDVCSYDVEFATTETGAATLSLANGWSTTVSGTSQMIAAEYTAPTMGSTFHANLKVRVPFVDSGTDADTDNDWTGTLDVRYRPVANSEPECRAQVETFTIDTAGSLYGGGTASPPGTRVALINQPQGKSTNCEYTADFVDALTDATLGTAAIQQGDNAAVSEASEAATVAYATGSVFFPDVNIHVADVNDDNDPATDPTDESMLNLFRGTTIAVTVAATGGTTAECTGGGTEFPATHTVDDDGAVTFSADGPMLLNVPDGETDSCEYTVTFPADPTEGTPVAAAYTLNLLGDDATRVIDVSNPNVLREYRRPAATPLTTRVVIAGSAEGVQWDVEIEQVANSHANCSPGRTLRLRTAADGTTDQSVTLVRRPVGANADGSEDCAYRAVWPTNEVDGTSYTRVDTETATFADIDDTTATVTASFVQEFAPMVPVSVPLLDGLTSGTNIWATQEFEVTFERASGVTHADCSLATGRDVTFTVQTDGSITPDTAELPPSLVHTTTDGTACSYTVTFPAPPTADANAELTWALTTPAAVTLSSTNRSATGAYALTGAITFAPDTTITVPASNANKAFAVGFTSTNTECSGSDGTAVTLAYTVASATATTATADATNSALVAYPQNAAASTDVCTYTATFSPTETGGTTLGLQPGADTALTGTDQAISATYGAALMASVLVSVPNLDGLTQGQNIWHGTELEVTFARNTTSASTAGCSLETSAMVTFTVGAGGAATADSAEMPGYLISETAAGDTCGYTVTFPDMPEPTPDSEFGWATITTPAMAELSATNPSATAVYDVAAISFEPDEDITVPPGHAGKRFTVTFTSAQPGCTPTRTVTYRIRDVDTIVAGLDTLNAYPADADDPADVCTYNVEFAMNENGGTEFSLAAGSTMSFSGTSQRIAATYDGTAMPTSFRPGISVRVPDLPGLMPSQNLWATEELTVTISRADGAHANCSLPNPVTRTYIVATQGGGARTTDTAGSMLTGVLADGTTTCAYTVSFAPEVGMNGDFAWELAAPSDIDITRESVNAAAVYTIGQITFVPDLTITVPAFNAGKSIVVEFRSTTTGCSATQTAVELTYTVEDDAATTATADPNNAALIAYPPTALQAQDACSYTATFPLAESGGTTLTRHTAETTTVTGTHQIGEVTYEDDASASTFIPSISMTVPQLNGVSGDNIWTGETFDVTFFRAGGVTGTCWNAPTVNLTYTVQGDGTVALTEGAVPDRLMKSAGGEACRYAVTFPAALTDPDGGEFDWTMTPTTNTVLTLSDDDRSVSHAYDVGAVTFDPDLTITVPTGNAGTQFNVSVESSDTDCSGSDGTPVPLPHLVPSVPADGITASPANVNPSLIAYPADATTSSDVCSYTVTFPLNEATGTTLTRETGATATVTGTRQAASATYFETSMGSTFTPSITVNVPDREGTTSGTNIWSAETLTVTLARTDTTTDANCSLPTSAELTYTVDAGATTTLTTGPVPTLTRLTTGGVECAYTVTYGDPPLDTDDNFDWTLTKPTVDTLSLGTTTADGAYTVGVVEFDPDPTITVRAGNHDKQLDVDFVSSQMGCTDQTLSYIVPMGGTTADPDTANNPSLVAYPDGVTTVCSYAVTFPDSEETTDTLAQQPSPTPDTTATGTDQAFSVHYGDAFVPVARVTVPLLDGTTVDENIWNDQEFALTVARATTPAQDAACSLPSSAQVTLTLGADGVVDSATDSGLPVVLVGTTVGGETCSYEVTFPAAPIDDDTDDFAWELVRATEMATLDADNISVSSAYNLVGNITFVPDVTINVPADNASKSFVVEVSSATMGCSGNPTAVELTYTVADATAQVAAPADANSPLIAYQSTATVSDDACEYTATFRSSEETTSELELQNGADTTLTGTDQSASATYAAPVPMGSTFIPTITVTVPDLDGTTSGTNIWVGQTFTVMIARTATSTHAECSLPNARSVVFTVQADRSVTPDAQMPASLTGTASDDTTKCAYTVTFPSPPAVDANADLQWALSTPTAGELSDTSMETMSATGAYALSGDITFWPDTDIGVPAGLEHVTKVFHVTFENADNADTDCTASRTLEYSVGASDTVSLSSAVTNTPLVAYPATATVSDDACTYMVTFQETENGAMTLTRQSGFGTTVSGTAQDVSAEYASVFEPMLSVTVPQLVGTTANENIWATEEFAVTIERHTGSASETDCSAGSTETVTFTVGTNGIATGAGGPSTLVGTLADETRCQYTVTFPAPPIDDDSDDFVWRFAQAATTIGTLDAGTPSSSRTYVLDGDVTFVPDITITVPMNNANKAFVVEVASTGTDCSGNSTPEQLRYVVTDGDGATTATAASTNMLLIAYPNGSTTVCSYTATFPMNEETTTTLTRSTAETATLTGTDQDAAATYAAS